MEFLANGGNFIQNAISKALSESKRMAKVTGNWLIEKTVRIPSDFTLILEDCHLRMADNTFCNMFTNERCRTEKGKTIEGTDRLNGRHQPLQNSTKHGGRSKSSSRNSSRHFNSKTSLAKTKIPLSGKSGRHY